MLRYRLFAVSPQSMTRTTGETTDAGIKLFRAQRIDNAVSETRLSDEMEMAVSGSSEEVKALFAKALKRFG